MHYLSLLLHRWVGLLIAGFLVITGLTGAVISWDHELDDLLNPHLTHVESRGASLSPLKLAEDIEARDPRARVTYIPLAPEEGEALAFDVDPRVNPATNTLYDLGYNQVFVDPVTGKELGKREWGAVWPVTTENLVSFLYQLHMSLHIPEMGGIDHWGEWLLGSIALLWALDCFVGFYLTLPRRASNTGGTLPAGPSAPPGWWTRWAPAWKIKMSGTIKRINLDYHRAFGLWAWGLLFMLAFTAFSLNLNREVFFPVMSTVSEVTPTAFDVRTPTAHHDPIPPTIGFAPVIDSAARMAKERGWTEPVGDAFYAQNYGIYGVRFFKPGDDHGSGGVGPPALYFDGGDGRYLGDLQPWTGTAADIFVQVQFPLHSGRILGLPGRILVSILGVGTAMLSITGVVIWWRKQTGQSRRKDKRAARAVAVPVA